MENNVWFQQFQRNEAANLFLSVCNVLIHLLKTRWFEMWHVIVHPQTTQHPQASLVSSMEEYMPHKLPPCSAFP
jgi:hypothetical protein